MLELIDTHCHIQSIGLAKGERTTRELWQKVAPRTIDDVVADARAAGVRQLICVGCDLEDSRLAIECVKSRENLYATIGIHPHEANAYVGQTGRLQQFAALAGRPKVVAVGECGLDYYYEHSSRAHQTELLRYQIELAIQHELPMVFHVRDAFDDFWPIFESYGGGSKIRGVLHSFTDSLENLERALSHNLFVGVNGIATFAKDQQKDVIYRTIPQQSLLLETDAPFLTPVPHRGTINEPKHILQIAKYLQTLRGESIEQLAQQTTRNAQQLFGLD
jgi:TatD DNase family protein